MTDVVEWAGLGFAVEADPLPSVGVTATRNGGTWAQLGVLLRFLHSYRHVCAGRPLFHEGDCIGGDVQAAKLARACGYWIVAHPCTIEAQRAHAYADEVRQPGKPLDRNRVIVRESCRMVAMPSGFVELWRGSGTWATIRETGRQRRWLLLIWPDGTYDVYPDGWTGGRG